MVGWNIFLILAAVIPYAGRILSAPTIAYEITTTSPHASNYVNPIWSPESRLPTTRATTSAETLRPPVSAAWGRDDYIVSENEYRQVLDRLREEAEAHPAADDSRNYVDDDAPMEEILRRIDQADSITSTMPSRTESTTRSIYRLVAGGPTEPYGAIYPQTIESASNQLTSQDPDDDDGDGDDDEQREMIHGHPEVSQYDECPICLDPMVESYYTDPDRHTTTLFCGHTFHTKCITLWELESYNSTARCPICRSVVSLRN